jgi:riboflavin biosynthesis pyrimidine reductase
MPALELLYEAPGADPLPLPERLAQQYGGPVRLPADVVYVNFVASADGVVAIPGVPRSTRVLGGGTDADRFVMALLRACADVLLIGASTFRGSAEARWTAASLYPPEAGAFAELRRALGKPSEPQLAVLTASGLLDPSHPALEDGALVVTTAEGAARLRGRLSAASELLEQGTGTELGASGVVAVLRERGHRRILSEGGPHAFGSLLDAGVADELFLTLSPALAGRAADRRLALVEGVELLPERRLEPVLASVRRDDSHLLLHYRLRPSG